MQVLCVEEQLRQCLPCQVSPPQHSATSQAGLWLPSWDGDKCHRAEAWMSSLRSGAPQSKLVPPWGAERSIPCFELKNKATASDPGCQEREPVKCGHSTHGEPHAPRNAEPGEPTKSSTKAAHLTGHAEKSLGLRLSPCGPHSTLLSSHLSPAFPQPHTSTAEHFSRAKEVLPERS